MEIHFGSRELSQCLRLDNICQLTCNVWVCCLKSFPDRSGGSKCFRKRQKKILNRDAELEFNFNEIV